MAYIVKQSTAIAAIAFGPFLDSADGFTAMTGLTLTQPDIRLSKNGGAFAQKNAAQTLSHMENGYYSLALDTTDTATVGTLRIHSKESGALPVWMDLQVVEEAIYDALYAASATGLLPTNVTQFGGSNGTFSGGRPEVNTTHAAGTAWNSGAITASTLAADTITAAKVAADVGTEIATAVWASATRLLTAGTNIVLAKGTGVTGFNDPAASAIADAVHDEVVDGTRTLRELTRGFAAALLGKVSGMDSNAPVFRDIADSKDVIAATTDSDGNRTAITLDLT